MVRLEPAVNRLKVKYFGDPDKVADEQALLYKKAHYSPFGSVIPVAIQVLLLIGLVRIIYEPEKWLRVQNLDTRFLGFDLSATPTQAGGIHLLIPILAGIAALILCLSQNRLNPLQASQGKAALVVFPLAVMLAFLVLAALYESWTLPLAVILIVPMTLLSALFGVWLSGGDNNVFVQVGLVVLMGLACKNAILIVEFARELELQGKGIVESALQACRLRLRPIVMTSIAFIAGTVPLVFSHGAGAEVRSATGITVFAGMLGVTLFGLFLTPVFYVALRKLSGRPLVSHAPAHAADAPTHA
jgi:hypothetical protein